MEYEEKAKWSHLSNQIFSYNAVEQTYVLKKIDDQLIYCYSPNIFMSSIKLTARLVAVCQKEQVSSFDKRQIPINIDENLIVTAFFFLQISRNIKNEFFLFN